jgi:pimeloyl-ACP methyl ester carboxylesterase
MPKIARSGQDWILDRFIGTLGVNALMPGFMTFMASPIVGFNNADLEYITKRTKGVVSMREAYRKVGDFRMQLANSVEEDGHTVTARRHYYYAALAYGFAQYTVQEDHSPLKQDLHGKSQEAFGKVIKYADYPMEKVEIPFVDTPAYDAATFPGVLHLPKGKGPFPCVIFIPGTDMHKEQVPNPEDNIFVKRGMAVLALDGPGQGESLLRMLKVRVETWNYERAVSAAIDYLETRPEIDSSKIATFGVSTGSYWSPRAAIWEARHKNRIKAAGGLAAQWDPHFVTEFEYAQPNFKSNYMYMAGEASEEAFDRKAHLHDLRQEIAEITCPILIVQGEFDELCTPDQVEAILANAKAPHEMLVYEDEFHPLGGVAVEAYEHSADWLRDRLDGKSAPQRLIRRVPKV